MITKPAPSSTAAGASVAPAAFPVATANGGMTGDPAVAGEVVAGCRIDLPRNDVIESIDFERFFRLNLTYAELRGPAVLPVMPAENSLRTAVPFSADADEWADFRARTADLRALRFHPAVDRSQPLESARAQPQALYSRDNGAYDTNALNSAGQLPNLGPMTLALYLPFRQEWKLRGYNRGRLVNSFTLAPQEEQVIEVFKWDRMNSSLESSSSFDSEDTNENSTTRRDTSDVARDVARQTGFETNSSGKVGFKVGVVNADLSAGFSARAGINDAEKETRGAITEATTRSTGRVRTSRTLKVVESREQGQETRTTRKLRNANNCHTLTVAFHEILANYEVNTFVRADAARLVVLINSTTLGALDTFTASNIRAHESALRLALMDRTLADGFDAARFLAARHHACEVLCTGCTCGDDGGMNMESSQLTNLRNAVVAIGSIVTAIRGYTSFWPASALTAPAQPAIDDAKKYGFRKALQIHAPRLTNDLAVLSIGTTAASVTTAQIESVNQALNSIAPDLYAKLLTDSGINNSMFGELLFFVGAMVVHEPIAALATTGSIWGRLNGLPQYDDFGLVAAVNTFRGAYAAWKAWVKEQIEKDEKLAALHRIEQQERDLRVLEAYPLRQTADAKERLDALLAHLNDARNRDHYRFAVWNERSAATDDTLMALALAGFIEPTPVGMVGDQLAMPVRLQPGSKLEKFFTDSMADLMRNPPRDRKDYILPTPALYADAIVGGCCSCEESIERNTHLDLELKRIENEIRALEARRLTARLEAETPLLDREGTAPPAIKVEVVNSAPAEAPVA